MLSRDDILKADDLTRESVEVPEWGGSVYVRTMNSEERDYWEACAMDKDGEQLCFRDRVSKIRARLAALTLCDENGEALFSIDEIDILAKKSGAALDRIFDVSIRLNRIGKAEMDELVKNSNASQDDDSAAA